MWDHGGWDIVPHIERGGPKESGVREPLVPRPSPPTLHTREPTED
jgi:hypothetical protein